MNALPGFGLLLFKRKRRPDRAFLAALPAGRFTEVGFPVAPASSVVARGTHKQDALPLLKSPRRATSSTHWREGSSSGICGVKLLPSASIARINAAA